MDEDRFALAPDRGGKGGLEVHIVGADGPLCRRRDHVQPVKPADLVSSQGDAAAAAVRREDNPKSREVACKLCLMSAGIVKN